VLDDAFDFETFFRMHYERVARAVVRVVRDPARAEEITVEAFWKFWRNSKSFAGATGKVRVVHRDFPLPQHPYAKLAARYANAAGEVGHYEEVVRRLFASQPEWAANGNVDAAVARVLPAETMAKVRALVESDAGLDATVAADMAMVARDQINQTPTIVFVYKGERRKVPGATSWELLRSYLNELLAQ
jgi:protein-disulfide isomerase